MPIPFMGGIFSLSYLPVMVGFFIRSFWMSRKAWGMGDELKVVGHTLLPCTDGAGFFLAKLRMQRSELSKIFSCSMIFLRGTCTLESKIAPLWGPWRGVWEFFHTFAAIMTHGLTKRGCANQFHLVVEQEKTGGKK
jgi:hypothetical protein